MRRLLIRLVALESMLVGGLGYWLFLVYANNPSVSQGLAAQLGRFPQLSFTTVDISVLVVIASLSIFLAFKFQRGLRPGIRLERALQMLENLMKRNLVLEAQVAELKLEKAHAEPSAPVSPPLEDRAGSWERAFRTPIEAGPSASPTPSRSTVGESSFEQRTSLARPTPRTDSRPVFQHRLGGPMRQVQTPSLEKPAEKTGSRLDKTSEMPTGSGSGTDRPSWEDSPRRVSETGVLTPSPPPKSPAGLVPVSNLKQPYIPVPVPKATLSPSVTQRPTVPAPTAPVSPEAKPSFKSMTGAQASPRSLSDQPTRPGQSFAAKLSSPLVPLPIGFAVPRSSATPVVSPPDAKPKDSGEKESATEEREDETGPDSKPASRPLKKPADDEED